MLKNIGIIGILIVLGSCSSYIVSTQSMVSQLKDNQDIKVNTYFQQFSLIDYPSNNLEKIKCVDKNGLSVWLYPDKNTEFIFVKKSDGKKVKAYFDTVIFQNDTIFGLRSRLVGGLREIPVNDIEKIEIYSEFPKIERVIE